MADRWRLTALGVVALLVIAGGVATIMRWPRGAAPASVTSAQTPAYAPLVAAQAPATGRPSAAATSASPTPSPSAARPSRSPTADPPYRLPANALLVGPGHRYAKPCQAIAVAKAGATIGIDAKGNSTYAGDVCAWTTDALTIVGYNGMAHIDAAGRNAQGKAIWVIAGDNTTVRNVELSGATVPDSNGAGIRQEGTNLTVIGCYFTRDQDGILAADNRASRIVVQDSQFGADGAGDGYSHNIY
ncbi:MAG TPA: hypothetical protein VGF84_00775, partial [Micromonosporaceae bacterium]